MSDKIYLTAKEAAKELGVSVTTLYAYVSRGLIRSESTETSHQHRYNQEDILALKARKQLRQDPTKAAEMALDWGSPVMTSEICLILEGNLYYRGLNVLDLATKNSLEEVASLIWLDDISAHFAKERNNVYLEHLQETHQKLTNLSLIEIFQVLIPLAAKFDIAAYDLRPAGVASTGAQILRLMVNIISQGKGSEKNLASTLQKSWAENSKKAAQLINAALIVCADHELNASTFTARCVASTGANPYLVVTAGLSALQGYKHGGQGEQVEILLQQAKSLDNVTSILVDRLRRGEKIPGFGHSLYPQGDPRAKLLIKLAEEFAPKNKAVLLAQSLVKEVFDLTGELPNLDMGLATISQVLNLPIGTAITLFAMGRVVGWLGHAIEQYKSNQLIRPRAKYVGREPTLKN